MANPAMDARDGAGTLYAALRRTVRRPLPDKSRGWVTYVLLVCVLLFLQGASGVLLSLYYLPDPESAADSVRYIMRDVEWGWLVRGIHAWGTTLIVGVLVVQLASSFVVGTYRGAGAGSWVIAVLVLLLVVGMAFTGELLVWDERSIALAVAALEGTERVPLIGPPLASMMRGGPEVGVATLARAHAAHVLLLPWLAFLLVLFDLWFRVQSGRSARDVDGVQPGSTTHADSARTGAQ